MSVNKTAFDNDQLMEDIEKVKRIDIVPKMLEVICRATGMGFAAIARVTEDRWIACSVRDEINFGLAPGGELEVKTTICDEIRDSRQAVIIDNVAEDPHFCNHHTPKMYGLQSYISMPIILHNGEFFGTLCAIDPRPAAVSDVKITGMFTLFAQLIAFHLQAIDMLDQSSAGIESINKKLSASQDETRQYEHITYHGLREPVRKISLYSDILLEASEKSNDITIRQTATDINRYSKDLLSMLRKIRGQEEVI